MITFNEKGYSIQINNPNASFEDILYLQKELYHLLRNTMTLHSQNGSSKQEFYAVYDLLESLLPEKFETIQVLSKIENGL